MRYTLSAGRGFAGNDWFRRGGAGAAGRWGAWTGVLAAASGIVTVAYLIHTPTAFWGDYLTWFIVAVFLGLLVRSLSDARTIDREANLASEQVAMLQQLNDVGAFLHQAEDSAFRSHINSLYTIMRTHRDIAQDTLIELLHAKLASRNRLCELLSNILLTLGLIGTIVGMLVSVGPLGKVLTDSSGDMGKVKEGLALTLAGLGTAYYTTLCGAAFGGVIMRILTNINEVAVTQYIALLAELTEVHVLPALRLSAEQLDEQGYYRRPGAHARAVPHQPLAARA